MKLGRSNAILGQSTRLTWALRSGGHTLCALTAFGQTRRKRWLLLGAAAALTDLAFARRLADPERPRPRLRLGFDTADAVVWAGSGLLSPAYLAAVTPAAVEAGYRFGAGSSAVPVPKPREEFPPLPSNRVASLARLLAPLVVPTVAARLRIRGRGHHVGPDELLAVASTLSGIALARTRHRLQANARSEWTKRSDHQVAVESRAAQVRVATLNSDGHSFKKVLVVLGYWGSTRAKLAGAEQMARPSVIIEGGGGTTLHHAVLGIPISPPESAVIWLSEEQVGELRTFLDERERVQPTGPAVIDVVAADWSGVVLNYLGAQLRLVHEPPPLASSLDPLPAALLFGATLKLLTTSRQFGGVAPPAAIAGVLLDLLALHRHRQHRNVDHQVDSGVLVAVSAGAAWYCLALLLGQGATFTPGGQEIVPATNGVLSMLLVLGDHWETLQALRRPAIAGAGVLWLAGTAFAPGRTVLRAAADGQFAVWAVAAVLGMGGRVRAEATALEDSLRKEFVERVNRERRAVIDHELHRYRQQLELAEQEIRSLGESLPTDMIVVLEQECARMRQWLSDPQTRTSLESWS